MILAVQSDIIMQETFYAENEARDIIKNLIPMTLEKLCKIKTICG